MNNKRILFLTQIDGQDMDGVDTTSDNETKIHPSKSYVFETKCMKAALDKNSIKHSTIEIPYNTKKSRIKRISAMLDFLTLLERKSQDYNVIICTSQRSFIISAIGKIFIRKPIVWLINDILNKEHYRPFQTRALIILSRLAANHIILNSNASKEAWLKAGGNKDKSSVIYSAIDTELFHNRINDKGNIERLKHKYAPKGSPLIGMFGRMSSWKGQDVFLRSLARTPNAHGIIVGGAFSNKEDYTQRIKNLANELGISDKVTFTGHMENIPELMAACDVIVHCSTSPKPFKKTIAEAMLAKTPIVASHAGGLREIITNKQNGYLYPIGDVDRLSDLLQYCIDRHNSEDDPLIKNAYNTVVEKFSSKAMINKLSNIIESL